MIESTYISPCTESRTYFPPSPLLAFSSSEKSSCEPPRPDALTRIQTNEVDSFLTPASSRTTPCLLCEAGLPSLRRLGDRQPRQCSRKAAAGDYLWPAGYEYVMRQP